MKPHFFSSLPLFTRFEEITRAENYSPVPDDWWILIADVVGSTKAIGEGRYKEVNVIGASVIIAVLNSADHIDLPYVFGGDGASLVVPRSALDSAKHALCGTRRMAAHSFGLELLVAAIPVKTIREAGRDLRIARFGTSRDFAQAMFNGGGLIEAERLAKDPATRANYELPEEEDSAAGAADFRGLECRWQGIPARGGETISLLVQVHPRASASAGSILDGVLRDIHDIYGDGAESQPVSPQQLNLCVGAEGLTAESRLRSHGHGEWFRKLVALRLYVETRIGNWMMKHNITTGGMAWGRYKEDVVANTDYRKFDDTLRMVLDSTPAQRMQLDRRLAEHRARQEVVYGIHVAAEALMTCLIFDQRSHHAHFVDGANGGYALAAQQMKAQLSETAG